MNVVEAAATGIPVAVITPQHEDIFPSHLCVLILIPLGNCSVFIPQPSLEAAWGHAVISYFGHAVV
jgi:hypothetical protein